MRRLMPDLECLSVEDVKSRGEKDLNVETLAMLEEVDDTPVTNGLEPVYRSKSVQYQSGRKTFFYYLPEMALESTLKRLELINIQFEDAALHGFDFSMCNRHATRFSCPLEEILWINCDEAIPLLIFFLHRLPLKHLTLSIESPKLGHAINLHPSYLYKALQKPAGTLKSLALDIPRRFLFGHQVIGDPWSYFDLRACTTLEKLAIPIFPDLHFSNLLETLPIYIRHLQLAMKPATSRYMSPKDSIERFLGALDEIIYTPQEDRWLPALKELIIWFPDPNLRYQSMSRSDQTFDFFVSVMAEEEEHDRAEFELRVVEAEELVYTPLGGGRAVSLLPE